MCSTSRPRCRVTHVWCRWQSSPVPANDYNLNIPRYIDSAESEDLHDLDAHLNGGIPDRDIDALDPYWTVFPTLRQTLFESNGRAGLQRASHRYATSEGRHPSVMGSLSLTGSESQPSATPGAQNARPLLRDIDRSTLPKPIIGSLSEDLLTRFADLSLLERYDVYQRLMDYWDEVMQDDVYLIAMDGWMEAAKPRGIIEDKEKKIRETQDLTIKRKKYKMDLISPPLIVARYFVVDQAAIETLQVKQETADRELEEFVEEHAGEDSLLEDAVNDSGKVTRAWA